MDSVRREQNFGACQLKEEQKPSCSRDGRSPDLIFWQGHILISKFRQHNG
jgi:hypothetical protein